MYIRTYVYSSLCTCMNFELQEDIEELERSVDDSAVFYQRQVLCTTLSGNPCPILTLTSQPVNVEKGVQYNKYLH